MLSLFRVFCLNALQASEKPALPHGAGFSFYEGGDVWPTSLLRDALTLTIS